ncbi:MAG: hypothetical protein ACKVPX_16455 [Myxococcaceae bacterium]
MGRNPLERTAVAQEVYRGAWGDQGLSFVLQHYPFEAELVRKSGGGRVLQYIEEPAGRFTPPEE